jgi:hypothetical protein
MASKNLDAIKLWVSNNRSDMIESIDRIANGAGGDAMILLMTTSFEAGRMFQSCQLNAGSYEPGDVQYYVQDAA